jgi:predicted solute-binding protein
VNATTLPKAGPRPPAPGAVRLGAVSYLNAAPPVHGLDRDPGFRVLREVPSRVARRLHAGDIDLGLIPSVEYAFGEYAIVPGIGIGSRGKVRSVLLFHRGRLDRVRRVALDTSSRTSATLVRILLRERLGRSPEYVPMAPEIGDMLAVADAALVIGEEWTRLTSLPFVYAFWAGRPGAVDASGVERLQSALSRGMRAVAEIALQRAGGDAARAAKYDEYLRESIVYRLGEEEQQGLREFYRRAHALSLVPRIPELRFHGAA